jgi:hypothetical protein
MSGDFVGMIFNDHYGFMKQWAHTTAGVFLFAAPVLAADLPPPPAPPPNASEVIAKQIGWLVIENANLQAQIEDLKKQLKECH